MFAGQLPADAIVANTAVDWSGTRWTQLLWPLPQDASRRSTLLAHEMFHRLQPALPIIAPTEGGNEHLDTLEGRYWLQLEWRALADALAATDAVAQHTAMMDALAFRAERHHQFPAAAQDEAALELNEGLAEYTGVVVGNPSPATRVQAALHDLRAHVADRSFVRSFAYATGPAYGLLLDQAAPVGAAISPTTPGISARAWPKRPVHLHRRTLPHCGQLPRATTGQHCAKLKRCANSSAWRSWNTIVRAS